MSEQPDEHASMEHAESGGDPGADPGAHWDTDAEEAAGEDFGAEEFGAEDAGGEDFPDEVSVDEDLADDAADESRQLGAVATATGHPAVDEVLRSLEGLDGRPVDDHVAAFEQAHEQLRRALSSAGDDNS